MKKRTIAFLLLIVMLSLMTVNAFAAATEPTTAGIYGIEGSGITPKTESGGAITPADIGEKYKGFYADAVKFEVNVTGLTAGEQYLLLVLSDEKAPTAENIVYINQAAADNTDAVSFVDTENDKNAAYPSSLVNGNTYYVYVVGTGKAFTAETGAIASFKYYQPYKLGDITEDKVIDTMDAAAAINHYLEKSVLTGNGFLAGDVTKDGVIDTMDAAAMINHYLEKSLITG